MTKSSRGPHPAAIAICPIVSRLSPSEEKMLLKTPGLLPDDGAMDVIPLHFEALLQLRIGAYQTFEAMPVYGKVRELLGRLEAVHQPGEIPKWVSSIWSKFQSNVI